MLTFLREIVDHAEWANDVFFHAWEKSPARDHEEMRHASATSLGCSKDSCQSCAARSPGVRRAVRPIPSRR